MVVIALYVHVLYDCILACLVALPDYLFIYTCLLLSS